MFELWLKMLVFDLMVAIFLACQRVVMNLIADEWATWLASRGGLWREID
jgi:hypothetical protein